MNSSLDRLRALPPDTRVYCGHEYTLANLRFALAVEPDNEDAHGYRDAVARLTAEGTPSLPSVMSREMLVNPFLRCDKPTVRAAAERHAAAPLATESAVFGALRAWKDQFR